MVGYWWKYRILKKPKKIGKSRRWNIWS